MEHHECQICEDGIRFVLFIHLSCHVHEVGKHLFSSKGILGYINAFVVLYEARQVYGNLFMVTVLDAVSGFVPYVQQA
jgi:hypothetical protein